MVGWLVLFLFSHQPVGCEGKIVSQSIRQRIPKYQFDTLEHALALWNVLSKGVHLVDFPYSYCYLPNCDDDSKP